MSYPPGRLVLITPPYMEVEKLVKRAAMALEGGVDAVQLRRWDMTGKQFYSLALRLKKLAGRSAKFIINDRLDVAKAVDADGVHLGRFSFPPAIARAIMGKKKIIGLSVHSVKEFSKSEERFLDYLIVSPIFKTPSKPKAEPLGTATLMRLKEKTSLSLYALGGINSKNIRLLRESGCGVAVISAIMDSRRPDKIAWELKNALI